MIVANSTVVLGIGAKIQTLLRIVGILLLGVFALNVYIGLYDTNLSRYNILHYYLDWVMAAITLTAAIVILIRPSNFWVTLSGVVWPLLYTIGLLADAATRLCLGTGKNCWPDTNTAFQYLILNNPNIKGGYGWMLWRFTIPSALVLLALCLVLSSASLLLRRKYPASSKDIPK